MYNSIIDRIIRIQNTQSSLGWGFDICEKDDSIVICVYHRVYKEVRFFWLPYSCTALYDLSKSLPTSKTLLWSSEEVDADSIIKAVQKQLKIWFPAQRH